MTSGPFLVLPGWLNSGPAHWQSLWEASDASFVRVEQRDWDAPDRDEWVRTLDDAVRGAGPSAVLVAHSMGCLTAVHWAGQSDLSIRGAMLVAVPDPDGPEFPRSATGFAPVPMERLPFATTVVVSADDPYASPGFSTACAQAWGARTVSVGARGHINGESGLGDWPAGRALVTELAR
jgi:uncharacterized protein